MFLQMKEKIGNVFDFAMRMETEAEAFYR